MSNFVYIFIIRENNCPDTYSYTNPNNEHWFNSLNDNAAQSGNHLIHKFTNKGCSTPTYENTDNAAFG